MLMDKSCPVCGTEFKLSPEREDIIAGEIDFHLLLGLCKSSTLAPNDHKNNAIQNIVSCCQ